jgi:hypothetical protein
VEVGSVDRGVSEAVPRGNATIGDRLPAARRRRTSSCACTRTIERVTPAERGADLHRVTSPYVRPGERPPTERAVVRQVMLRAVLGPRSTRADGCVSYVTSDPCSDPDFASSHRTTFSSGGPRGEPHARGAAADGVADEGARCRPSRRRPAPCGTTRSVRRLGGDRRAARRQPTPRRRLSARPSARSLPVVPPQARNHNKTLPGRRPRSNFTT